jgi:hypothetical protein
LGGTGILPVLTEIREIRGHVTGFPASSADHLFSATDN